MLRKQLGSSALTRLIHMQVAVIRGAARGDQQVWRTSLSRGAEEVSETKLSPCIVVIGKVGSLGLLQGPAL